MLIGEFTCLRAVENADLELLRDWRNIQDFRVNFREHRELNMENQKKWFDRLSNSTNDYMFVILDKATNELIGACGLLYTDWIIRSADFSFYVGKDNLYIDEKYSEDAVKVLLDFGFNVLNLHKIWMELYEYDLKKLRFFQEKFNFQVDGRLRSNVFAKGKYWDSYIISLLVSDRNFKQ
jgi:RimJ/RimL family protein N-acetyltransferase